MNSLNRMCELCRDDWRGRRPASTHAYFAGNGVWRGVCAEHAKSKTLNHVFVVTVESLMKGSDIKWEK